MSCYESALYFANLAFMAHIRQNHSTSKGQTNLKWFFQDDVSSKKRTNKFNFTTCQLVFIHFLEESEDT